jgi:hypothetical protein
MCFKANITVKPAYSGIPRDLKTSRIYMCTYRIPWISFLCTKLAQYKIRASINHTIHKYISASLFALFVSLFLFITSAISFYFLYSFLVYFLCVYSSYFFSIHLSSLLGLFICLYVSLHCKFFPICRRSSFCAHSLNQHRHPPSYLKSGCSEFQVYVKEIC